MSEEQFGPLYPFIQDDEITDINWNGRRLWIEHLTKGRYSPDIFLPTAFVHQFTSHVSNVVSLNFNKHMPLLEAEANGLRISIIHEAYAKSGRSISIRKSPPIQRLKEENLIKEGYCTKEQLDFLKLCASARMNILICGQTGSGKTELLKFLTRYIPEEDRVITIEDNLEIHYSSLHPDRDSVELKVDENHFTYTQAIKACLRQMPDWILLSEARGNEVRHLMESLTTGHYCITTMHTDDVRKIPERIGNMVEDSIVAERIRREVYTFLDIAILVRRGADCVRYIDQIAAFDAKNKKVILLSEFGENHFNRLPENTREKFERNEVYIPFYPV
ncbi:MAG: CpaF/VirB11 family protein [Lachnospiraceae bacterium]|nr:CpaF/VirB11 family protein [Lachnospiraceae bacterium]